MVAYVFVIINIYVHTIYIFVVVYIYTYILVCVVVVAYFSVTIPFIGIAIYKLPVFVCVSFPEDMFLASNG